MSNNLRDVMLDLETMGSSSKAAIVAIGAVAFDLRGSLIQDTFYEVIDLGSSMRLGGHVEASTVYWWLAQSDAARAELLKKDPLQLPAALLRFTEFIDRCTIGRDDVRIWGNGSDFDNVILGGAYDRAHLQRPWKFHRNRCYRTVKNLFHGVPLPELAAGEVAHNALTDALRQTKHLLEINDIHFNNLGEDHTR